MRPESEAADEIRKTMANIARAMLRNEIGLLEGCRQLASVSRRLPALEASDPDVLTFVGVDSESDDIPLGSVRTRWAAEALAEKDNQRDEYLSRARESIEQACRAIVDRYS